MKDDGTDDGKLVRIDGMMLARMRGEPITVSLLILDRSGSMTPLRDETKRAANRYLRDIRKSPNAESILQGLTTFANDARMDIPFVRATDLGKLDEYQPNGLTRLYATVADALDELMVLMTRSIETGADVRIVVSVMTDGRDEPPSEGDPPDHPRLRKIAGAARDLGFILQTYGIGVDGASIAREMNFPDDESHAFTLHRTADGMDQSMTTASRTTILTSLGRSHVTSEPISPPPSSH